jgi:hypothetical protein
MARLSSPDADLAHAVDRSGHRAAWAMLAIPLVLAGLALAAYLPAELLLASVSVLLVLAGFAIAAGCWLAGQRTQQLTGLRQVAAALVFLGFAGTILTDTREALAQLQQLEARALAAYSK